MPASADNQSAPSRLETKKVSYSPLETAPWGTKTTFRLPSGGEIGLYQPTHPTALDLK